MRYFLWTVLIFAGVVVGLFVLFITAAAVNVIRTMRRYGDLTMMGVHGEQLRLFYRRVEEYFRGKGKTVAIRDGLAKLTSDGHDETHQDEPQLGLQNLSQQCAQCDEKEWAEIIAQHFDAIERSHEDAQRMLEHVDDYEQVKPLLAVRIMPRYDLPLDSMVCREDLKGTVTTLVFDLPTSLRAVQVDEERHWPVGLSRVWRDALENTRRLTTLEVGSFDLGEGISMKAITASGNYVTTHALLLEEHPEWIGPHGALVAIPHRQALLVYPISDMNIVTAIQKLIFITVGMEKEGPGSITANVYWYRPDGMFRNLPYELKGKALNFHPPDEFVEMLNKLAAPPAT